MSLEAIVCQIADEMNMDLYGRPHMCVFPIYGVSGGIAARVVFYLKRKDAEWPTESVDLGREKYSNIPGVFSVECSFTDDYDYLLSHVRKLIQ